MLACPRRQAKQNDVVKESGFVSVYQYYEFQAIDRPLEQADQEALRNLSSRAQITSSSFSNHYNWGDFHGNPRKMMERWFDLHLYLANWGSRRFMMRIPRRFIDRSRIKEFVREVDEVKLLEAGHNLIVDIRFNPDESEDPGYGYSDEAGEGWLESLAPLRNDVLSGDLRLFYLLWLTAVERNYLRDEGTEPLPGIAPLSAPLEAFSEFFEIDSDLVQAAAESPSNAGGGSSFAEASPKVIESMPESEKAALLLRVVEGDPHVAADIRNKIRAAWETAEGRTQVKRRTVAEIRKRALAVREEREVKAAKRRKAERLRKAREAERARRVRLDSVRRRGARVWDEVEREIEFRNASSYDRAASLLADLQTLANETGTAGAFSKRVQSIRDRHKRKWSFIKRLRERRIGFND